MDFRTLVNTTFVIVNLKTTDQNEFEPHLPLICTWEKRSRSPVFSLSTGREGVRLTLTLDDGKNSVSGIGEAWPLPGWSKETISDVVDLLTTTPKAQPISAWQSLYESNLAPPSLRWALSAAIWRLSNPPCSVERHVAWLVQSTFCSIFPKLIHLRNLSALHPRVHFEPPPTVKIKIQGWTPSEVLGLCDWVQQEWPDCQLRLDANQTWPWKDVWGVARHPISQCISFWEEPCSITDLPILLNQRVPIALDESLRSLGINSSFAAMATAWICKPTLMGSLQSLLQLRKAAEIASIPLIFSSCFEGSSTIGLFMEMADPQYAHGFDPYWFHESDGSLIRTGRVAQWIPLA